MTARLRIASMAATACLALAAGIARADDTDIYVSGTVPEGSEPMVMFSLDYRPNLTATACQDESCDYLIAEGYLPAAGPYTFFDVLRAVLRRVMKPIEGVKVGLMLNHDHRNNCANKVQVNCSNGGYIARGFELFEDGDGNGAKEEFHKILAEIPVPQGNQSHAHQGKELFFEFYRYLSGQGIYNGHVGFTDYSSDGATNLDVDGPGYDWDTDIEAGGAYVTPIEADAACTRIFTINLMFQVSSQDADSDVAIKKSVANGGLGIAGNSVTFPQVIQWLHDADVADGTKGTAPDLVGTQNVTSYFIVDPTKINTTTTAYAQAGGTGVPLPLDADPKALERTLTDIFKQILSVSTTFVAASIPVNVFNRAEVVDNVFLSLFQPDAGGQPAWPGNVKKLRIAGANTNAPYLVDATNTPAVAPDGRLRFDALTHWTDAATLPAPDVDEGEVAGRDGRAVSRGAAGQKIPGFVGTGPGATNAAIGGRRLYYDTPGGALGNLNADLATAPLLKADFGVATDAEALDLLKYARGMDVDDLDGDGNVTEARSWIFGDPLHSRPLPINFGARGAYTEENPAIFVAVTAGDGYLRLIRNTTTVGTESGREMWAFMPRGIMGRVPVLRTNAAGIKHPYLIDSSPVTYLNDEDSDGTLESGEEAYLYAGLRRGGYAYYALDIEDPAAPEFAWLIEKGGDFAELGLTFSEPRVMRYLDSGGDEQVGLIFAGGYDEDKDKHDIGADDDEGNAIFVVDARTGKLVWKAVQGGGAATDTVFYHPDLTDSISSAVSLLDSNGDSFHDRAYVGDTGGKVWRVDMHGPAGGEGWQLTLLANLGRHAGAGDKASDRRFTSRPDIVLSNDSAGPFDAVLLGTGDREDPLDKGGTTENWFFMIKDRNTLPGAGVDSTLTIADLGDVTSTCLEVGAECSADLTDGWALQLASSGEKALSTPITVNNTVYFTTYLPPGSDEVTETCGPSEGSGRLYAVSLFQGAAKRNYDSSTESLERYTELNSAGIPAEVVSLPPNAILRPDLQVEPTTAPTRFETYWFEAEDGDL